MSQRLTLFALSLAVCGCQPDKTRDTGAAGTTEVDPDTDGDGDPDTTDCAPDDPTVHAGAEEQCNGVDDDCDGTIDDGPTGYLDEDGDGYGATLLSWCDTPEDALLVAEGGDCDDTDADVHPGADDPVCDGEDHDCDGRGEQVYSADGDRYASLDEALLDVDDGADLTICPGTHPTRAVLDRPISVTIRGETGDRDEVVLDGQGIGTILYVGTGASVALADITLTDGRGERWVDTDEGGALAIYESDVALDNVVVEWNLASRGGGIVMYQDMDGLGTPASLTMRDSELGYNTSLYSGAGLYVRGGAAEVTIDIADSGLNGNRALSGSGGAIALSSGGPVALTATDSIFTLNWADRTGGAISTDDDGDVSLTLESGWFRKNTAEADGGSLNLRGQGHLTLVMSDLHFEGNLAYHNGGVMQIDRRGSFTADISDSTFEENEAWLGNGGALRFQPYEGTSSVVLSDVELTANYAYGDGGAIALSPQTSMEFLVVDSSIIDNDARFDGGGLYVNPSAELDLTLRRSSVSGNTAERGAGLYTLGYFQDDVRVLLDDAEVYGNYAYEDGGGLLVRGSTRYETFGVLQVQLLDSVLERNTADGAAGAMLLDGDAAEVAFTNTAVTSNRTGNVDSCAVQLEMTADLVATTTDWGTGTTENDHCDVIDTLGQSVDLTATADILCTDGVCATE